MSRPLPNELSSYIIDYLSQQEDARLVNKDLRSVAQTTRLFREIALSHACRSIQMSNKNLNKLVRRQGGDSIDSVLAIKTRCLYAHEDAEMSKGMQYFPKLEELNLSASLIAPVKLEDFSIHACLRTLVIGWYVDERFPNVTQFPNLSTLAIELDATVEHDDTAQFTPPLQLATYSNLTSLYINENSCRFRDQWHHTGWFSQLCEGITLPNLRNFTLRYSFGPFNEIFSFIQRHPSILEVNVSHAFHDGWIPVLLLLKLIEGTGIWKRPPDGSEPFDDSSSVDDSDPYLVCAFGFTRIPDTSAAPNRRFLATSLALDNANIEDYGPPDDIYERNLVDLLSLGKRPVFSKLEYLWLSVAECVEQKEPFPTMMASIAYALKSWPSLRSLHLAMCIHSDKTCHWDTDSDAFDYLTPVGYTLDMLRSALTETSTSDSETSSTSDSETSSTSNEDEEQPLDEDEDEDEEQPLDEDEEQLLDKDEEQPLDEDEEHPIDKEHPLDPASIDETLIRIYAEISQTLNIPLEKIKLNGEDSSDDGDSSNDKDSSDDKTSDILRRFWHARHRDKMAAHVRKIGVNCNTLEEFVWYTRTGSGWNSSLENKWIWRFGEPDGQGGRRVEDEFKWLAPEDQINMPVFVGEMSHLIKRWETCKELEGRGFNPYKANIWR
ncbi:hypothetical protein QCA50_000940 [Cerrena zonata]|uniref:F-box domain-containing protein n=1 Tax=Cerrena zonata TaxID=2478898 RepID=A0AAW0H0K0_9APHY